MSASNTCKMISERPVYVKLFLYFFYDDHKGMQLRRVPDLRNIKEFKAHIATTCSISEDFDLRKADGSFLFEDEELSIISSDDILIVMPVFKSTCKSCRRKRNATLGSSQKDEREQVIVFSPERHSSVQPDQMKKKRKRSSPDSIPRELTHRRINFFEDLNASKEENETPQNASAVSKNSSGPNLSKREENLITTVETPNRELQEKKEDSRKEKKLLIEHFTPAHSSMPTNDFTNTLKVNLISSYVVNLEHSNDNEDKEAAKVLTANQSEAMEHSLHAKDDKTVVLSPKSNETTENGSGSNTPDISDSLPKVKRHRIRTRKKKKKTRDEIVDSPMPASFMPRPLMLHSKPKLHVHFEDAQANCNEESEMAANEQQMIADETAGQPAFNPLINSSRKVKHLSELRPKDVILFRKHKLLPNFCPGISNNIVGRVESFYLSGKEDDEIQLTIIEGLEEFNEPQGIFTSFDCGDQAIETVQLEPKQILRWNQLIEPCLLNN